MIRIFFRSISGINSQNMFKNESEVWTKITKFFNQLLFFYYFKFSRFSLCSAFSSPLPWQPRLKVKKARRHTYTTNGLVAILPIQPMRESHTSLCNRSPGISIVLPLCMSLDMPQPHSNIHTSTRHLTDHPKPTTTTAEKPYFFKKYWVF